MHNQAICADAPHCDVEYTEDTRDNVAKLGEAIDYSLASTSRKLDTLYARVVNGCGDVPMPDREAIITDFALAPLLSQGPKQIMLACEHIEKQICAIEEAIFGGPQS